MAEEKKEEQKLLKVNAGTVVGSTYSQIVGVTATNTDITLELISKPPKFLVN